MNPKLQSVVTPPRKLPPKLTPKDVNASGMGEDFPAPDGVAEWSWGAFLLCPIWAVRYRKWSGLLSLIPVIGIYFAFRTGVHGREWLWQHRRWANLQQFRTIQARWSMVALILYALVIISGTAFAFHKQWIHLPSFKPSDIQVPKIKLGGDTPEDKLRKRILASERIVDSVTAAVEEYMILNQMPPENLAVLGFDENLPEEIQSILINKKNGVVTVTMNIPPCKTIPSFTCPCAIARIRLFGSVLTVVCQMATSPTPANKPLNRDIS